MENMKYQKGQKDMIKLVIGVAKSFLINLYNSIWEMGNKNSSSETTNIHSTQHTSWQQDGISYMRFEEINTWRIFK
jgi:hypothetical protein